MDQEPYPNDVYPPQEIARKVERLGVAKANTDTLKPLVLAVHAGAFISPGARLFTAMVTESSFGFGPTRLLGGLGFCLGLILVVVAGAVSIIGVCRNVVAVSFSNHVGGTLLVAGVYWVACLRGERMRKDRSL